MHLRSKCELGIGVRDAWRALHSSQALQASLPTVRTVEDKGAGRFRITMLLDLGVSKSDHTFTIQLRDVATPSNMIIERVTKDADKQWRFDLELSETSHGCQIIYDGNIDLPGSLGKVGAIVMKPVAKRMAREFCNSLERHVRSQLDRS